MSATVLTPEQAKAAKIDVIANGRASQAVHEAVVAMRANRRAGTACTKTKAEVAFSGRKPWKQKGTGRARAGYASSPVWRKGGVVFGPKPRDYSKTTPRKVRRLAFLKALSARILSGDVLVVEEIRAAEPKTKLFLAWLKGITAEPKALAVGIAFDAYTVKAARNLPEVRLVSADEVNTEDLLNCRKVIVTRDALARLAERTAKP